MQASERADNMRTPPPPSSISIAKTVEAVAVTPHSLEVQNPRWLARA
jgi:hypothetical protein